MANTIENMKHAAERQAVSVAVDGLFKHIKGQSYEDRVDSYIKIVNLTQKFIGNDKNKATFDKVREGIRDNNSKWIKYINRIIDDTDPGYAKNFIMTLGYEAFLCGTKKIRENREKYHCNIPWLILFDPTMACNMHCVGCWSGTYGHKSNLSYEDMDKIVTEVKAEALQGLVGAVKPYGEVRELILLQVQILTY